MQIRFKQFAALAVVVCLIFGFGSLRTSTGQDGVTSRNSNGAANGETRPESVATPASVRVVPSEVLEWAAQLADPVFSVRQAATEKLIAAGEVVIEPVTGAALEGSLEAGLRAVRVLTALYESDDETVPVEAIDRIQLALEKLVEVGPASVGQEAAATLDRNLFTITQRRSIDAIRRFGAMYKVEHEDPVFFDGSLQYPPQGWVRSVAIGPEWTGGREGVEHLARLKTIEVIYLLKGHPLTEDDQTVLLQNLPRLRGLEPRGTAFLGVATGLDPIMNYGAQISGISPNSAAELGGMQLNDVVVEIAGKKVGQPEDLIAIVGEYAPGDEIDVIVLRDKSHMSVQSRFLLRMMDQGTQSFSPILAIGILENLRTPLTIKLGKWKLDQ